MRTYSVTEVSDMLDVNAETVRRWIRNGKLQARRAMGPGGNTILLEDIVAFANKPPRAYLLSLEAWLDANDISYQKIEEPSNGKSSTSKDGSAPTDTKTCSSASMVPAVAALTAASSLIPLVGPAVAATAVTTAVMKRRNYQSHSIQLANSSEEPAAKNEEITAPDYAKENSENSPPDLLQEGEKENQADFFENETDVPHNEAQETTTDILDQIAHAKKLLDTEIITQEEFTAIKARLIAKI